MLEKLTLEEKSTLIGLDPRTQSRVGDLSLNLGLDRLQTREIVARYGIKTAITASMIRDKCRIPIALCLQLAKDPNRYQAATKHQNLIAVLQSIDEEREFTYSRVRAVGKPGLVGAGISYVNRDRATIISFTDLFSACHPSKEDIKFHPELQQLFDMDDVQGRSSMLNGTLGYVEIGIPVCSEAPTHCPIQPGKSFLLVTNGQARKAFFRLPSSLRGSYKKWYESLLKMNQDAARKAGIANMAIASNNLVNDGLMRILGHSAPSSVLDQFYDGFCKKRGYKRTHMKFFHPINMGAIEGDVWVAT